MGIFGDLGDLFDFNGDGKTDLFEESVALNIMGVFDDEKDKDDEDNDYDHLFDSDGEDDED